jgi:hypothetical protein
METSDPDPHLHVILDIELGGLPAFIDRHPGDAAERVRHAYDYAWQQLYGYVHAEAAGWHTQPSPEEQLLGVFERLWSIRTQLDRVEYANFAFVGRYSRSEQNALGTILEEPSGYFYENEFERQLEGLCRSGNITGADESPEVVTARLMKYAETVFLTSFLMSPEVALRDTEAQKGIEHIITGGKRP